MSHADNVKPGNAPAWTDHPANLYEAHQQLVRYLGPNARSILKEGADFSYFREYDIDLDFALNRVGCSPKIQDLDSPETLSRLIEVARHAHDGYGQLRQAFENKLNEMMDSQSNEALAHFIPILSLEKNLVRHPYNNSDGSLDETKVRGALLRSISSDTSLVDEVIRLRRQILAESSPAVKQERSSER